MKAGKTPHPFGWGAIAGGNLASDMVYWDNTFTQEGAYVEALYDFSETLDLHGVVGTFVVDHNDATKDPRLSALQLGARQTVTPDFELGLRSTWYEWRGLDAAFVTRQTGTGNLATSFGNNERARVVELGSYGLFTSNETWPIRLYGSVSQNLEARSGVVGGTRVGDEDLAWSVGIEFGDPGKVGIIGMNIGYVEAGSVISQFKDGTPTDGTTNRKEWHGYVARRVLPSMTLAMDLFIGRQIEDEGAFAGCTPGACGPFEASISNANRSLLMTNLVLDF